MSKCFCHFNGYEVKDAAARRKIDSIEENLTQSFNFKGSCLSNNLPTTATINDTWYCTDLKYNKTWNGSSWYQSSIGETEYQTEIEMLKDYTSQLKEKYEGCKWENTVTTIAGASNRNIITVDIKKGEECSVYIDYNDTFTLIIAYADGTESTDKLYGEMPFTFTPEKDVSGFGVYTGGEYTITMTARIYPKESMFYGKKVMFFGDSITENVINYRGNLLKFTGLKQVLCNALSGATLTNFSDTIMDGNVVMGHQNTVPNQVQKLLNNHLSYGIPDIIVIGAGTNDAYSDNLSFDETQYTNNNNVYKDIDLIDLTSFSGSIRWCYEKLNGLYPDAKIMFATPIQSATSSREYAKQKAKADCIIANCERLSTPYIDAFTKSGIYSKYETEGSAGKYLKDGLHPNKSGADILAKCYANEIAKELNTHTFN